MAIEPLHVRLRAAAFRAQSNVALSSLLLEAAGALGPAAADRGTEATIRRHSVATANPAGDVISPRTFSAPEPPAASAPQLATCGHCGEDYAVGVSHCPECSGRVA